MAPHADGGGATAALKRKKLPSDAENFNTVAYLKKAIAPSRKSAHYPRLASLVQPHIDSFNAIFRSNPLSSSPLSLLDRAIADIGSRVVYDRLTPDQNMDRGTRLEMWFDKVNVAKPTVYDSRSSNAASLALFPAECRARGITYKGIMQAELCWKVGPDGTTNRITIGLGLLPIMVRSSKCHLQSAHPQALVSKHEDADEFGGYFIVNGNERLIRLLVAPRRNFPIALSRNAFVNRGPTYSPYGVQMRCVRPDSTSQTITLHYCTDGAVVMRFSFRKQEYMVPVLLVMRALRNITDREIFDVLSKGKEGDSFLTERIELLLRGGRRFAVHTKEQALRFLGSRFHILLDTAEDITEEEAGLEFIRRIVLVHLSKPEDKFNAVVFMIQKLYCMVSGDYGVDNPDSPQNWEVLLGGQLYLMYLKEKLYNLLRAFKAQIQTDLRRYPTSVNFTDRKYIEKVIQKTPKDLGAAMQYLLATGNVVTDTGLDLQQMSGFTIVAEKLNFLRYISHFRAIHRGAFFNEVKTTAVRKLLPEAWGFLCPVHTPDGAPCGLLNHLSHTCHVVTSELDVEGLGELIASLGVAQGAMVDDDEVADDGGDDEAEEGEKGEGDGAEALEMRRRREDRLAVGVVLDGKVVGWVRAKKAKRIVETLRYWKVKGMHKVPLLLEIAYVPPSRGGQYPGIYIFSSSARMMRPVVHLATGKVDMIGSFEQVYMDVACVKEDVVPGVTTHMEQTPTNILSEVANFTPFSDFNQSPRNMYQCQMGKQTMGTPANNFRFRTDNKLYRIQNGQTPIVRPKLYDDYAVDSYPNGTNAVVAVISYTGYDMEDASIINKSSHERGYGYGTVYKTEIVDLKPELKRRSQSSATRELHFGLLTKDEMKSGTGRGRGEQVKTLLAFLDWDGLPHVGTRLKEGDPFYAFVDDVSGTMEVKKYKGSEEAYVDDVIISAGEGDNDFHRVAIKLRIPRPPIIGDKFSSRHGQKGVCSQKWPAVDMPFSESGIMPDVIINPHAFPSRMTIGMFVESLAGKAGAIHGVAQDATPFTFSESYTAADHFGEQLRAAGFNYHGNEPMYSGITGKEFKADIYLGVVYYQRLRHMVSDKYQVRTTGPVHNLTQQPIKGRKRAGGIRFGEMERDSLLAHGTSFLLQDRLMNCSDYTQAHVCKLCGSVLSPLAWSAAQSRGAEEDGGREGIRGVRERVSCVVCKTSKGIEVIAMPYVFRYLCSELVAMNIRLRLEIE
ncbi:hypothetical protein BJ742DRAFT_761195 [Cladochytrium replicatum]|nr:hypothetical protein BJ742DRAFT_761195 [Cladochytrium replicatum]